MSLETASTVKRATTQSCATGLEHSFPIPRVNPRDRREIPRVPREQTPIPRVPIPRVPRDDFLSNPAGQLSIPRVPPVQT